MTTNVTPFPIIVKQNPYLKEKWDIRVGADIDKYKAGEVLCSSKHIDYCQHHFLIGDKKNIEILPDVIEVTTYRKKANITDPDVVDSVEIFDRNAPRVRKTRKKKTIAQHVQMAQPVNNATPVVSSNPWAAMLGQAFSQQVEDSPADETQDIEKEET